MSSLRPLVALAMLLAATSADAADYAVTGVIKGADGGWDFAAVDAATNRLFVARSNGVMAVDLATQKVTEVLVEGEGVHGVLPIPGTPYALSANGKANTAALFDKTSGKIEATIPTGQGPDAIVVEPKTGLVLVFNGKSRDATLIDASAKTVAGTVALDGKPEVAAADGTGRVFVNLEDKNAVAAIDVAARKVVATYPLNGCEAPTGLAFDMAAGLLIAACDNEVAKALDASTGADVATLKIGKGPDGVLLDAPRRRAFVPAADGALTVLALGGRHEISVAETVATAPRARTGAVDPATGKIYLPHAKMLPPENEGARPKPEPGTFEILVVAPTK